MENLFAYGTLIFPDKQQKLFGRTLDGKDDVLNNYTKNTIIIDGEVYPCVDESEGENTHGVVYQVTSEELLLADEYEGKEYKRIKTILESCTDAWVYVRT
jgi:gamma-glutamylcyclotransferase (GGCT)/AIG2-like uncharacterized protein YtfP